MISAILFAIGMLLLLRSAIVITFSLLKIVVLLVAFCGYALVLVVAGCGWLVSWFVPRSEPVITITIVDDVDDVAPVIELPRESYRRVRG
jgi:hypothetical protein